MSFDPFAPQQSAPAADPFSAPAQTAPKENPVINVGQSDGKVVVTLKQGTGFDSPWLVIHAADAADAKQQLRDVMNEDLLNAITITANAFIAAKQGNTAPAAPPSTFQAPQQQYQQQAPQAQPAANYGPIQSCQHGQKTVIQGKFGPFWACPADRNDPSKCKAQKAFPQ